MKKKNYVFAIAATLSLTMAFATGANAMLSEEEQREAYVKKAVEKAIAEKENSEEKETESETESETQFATASETESETEYETATEKETESEIETETERETKAETESENEAEEIIIVAIDPGHQGPGADLEETEPVGPGSDKMKACRTEGGVGCVSDTEEYELNLDVAFQLKDELESRGYKVVLTRDDNDTEISNVERAQLVNESGAQALIRIHADQSENSDKSGATASAPTYDNPYTTDVCKRSNALASILLDSYCEKTGIDNLGVWLQDDMTTTNWSKVPSCLLELGYLSNSHDDTYITDEDNQKTMAEGIADGVDLYFGR